MDTIFRTTPEVRTVDDGIPTPAFEPAKDSTVSHYEEEPVDLAVEGDTVLKAMGIEDSVSNLPAESQSNLSEVGRYVREIIDKRGLEPVASSYKKVLGDLKFEMGLDPDTDPENILDRIGGVVRAWRDISFIGDNREKRALFMKLARMQSSKEMNRAVFEKMEDSKLWI